MSTTTTTTSTSSTSRVAFLGAGNIAGPYAEALARHPELALVGVFDLDPVKRAEFAAAHGCAAYTSLDELVSDVPDVVVNLTSAPYHYATTRDLIERGQVVFSEKPLALRYDQARELDALAADRGVRLACAPSLWLGAATLEAAAQVSGGHIGTVRMINAEVNQGRIESWHPAPHSFYQVGPVFDAGVYPLAYLTAVFGPIRRVSANSAMLMGDRTTQAGESFTPPVPDAWVVFAEFASGPVLRLTCTFFVDSATAPRYIDFHGDDGSVRLRDWIQPGSGIDHAGYGEEFQPFTAADPTLAIDWSLGLVDLAAAIREDRPHRTGSAHAAHVVEILEAISLSAESGTRVSVDSDFPSPLPSLSLTALSTTAVHNQ